MNLFELELDVDKRGNNESVTMRQGDINGTTIVAVLRDHGIPVEGGEYTAYFCMTLPDRKTYYRDDATYVSGVVSVTVDERVAAAVPGSTNNAYFELYDGEELKYTTDSFMVRVKPSAMDGNTVAHSYDSRVEEAISELEQAVELWAPPTITVEEVEGGHSVTITMPTDEETFVVLDGEKGDTGDKGDPGDPSAPGSIGMEQLSNEVKARINGNRMVGTITNAKPTVTDAYNTKVVGAEASGVSTQPSTPTISNPVPVSGISEVVYNIGGTTFSVPVSGNPLRSLPNGVCDELVVGSDGSVTVTQRVGVVDPGTLSWAKTDTKTGGISRYFTSDLASVAVKPSSNNVVGNVMSDMFRADTYTNTYNRVTDCSVAISSNGNVAVYSEEYAGNLHTVSEFTGVVSGGTMLYELVTPRTHQLTAVELVDVPSSSVTVTCNAPFKLYYERDIYLVVEALERAVIGQ